MKNSVLMLSLCLTLLLSVQGVLAETEINIKTLPEHDIRVNIAQVGNTYQLIEGPLKTTSDNEGLASINSESSADKVNVFVQIDYDNKKIIVQRFDDVNMGSELFLQVEPGEVSEDYREEEWYLKKLEIEVNESKGNEVEVISEENAIAEENDTISEVVVEEIVIDESNNEGAGITGFSVLDSVKGMAGIFYIIILLVVVLVVVLVIRGVVNRKASASTGGGTRIIGGKSSNVNMKSQNQRPISDQVVSDEQEIDLIEQKIKEAKADLAKLKNKDKIKEAEVRIKKDQEDLENLKRGDSW